jgi:hypothetical protein
MFLRCKKKRKARLKPFLYGKIFELTVEREEEAKQVLKKRDVIREILDLRIYCDIQFEKKKKYKVKFKFRDKDKMYKYFNPFGKIFEISKRMKRKFVDEKFNIIKKKLKMVENPEDNLIIFEERIFDNLKSVEQENENCNFSDAYSYSINSYL